MKHFEMLRTFIYEQTHVVEGTIGINVGLHCTNDSTGEYCIRINFVDDEGNIIKSFLGDEAVYVIKEINDMLHER